MIKKKFMKAEMKLYTEFEVNELRRALKDIVQWNEDMEDDWEDVGHRAIDALRNFEKLTPIQLPSDEEIEKHSRLYGIGFPLIKIGAKWVIDKIKNQQ